MPSASPWRAGGVQRETKPTPTENDAPARPRRKPAARSCVKLLASGTSRHAPATTSWRTAITARPPKRSPSTPIGSRASDPSSTGVAIRRPVALPESPSVSRKRGASAPISPQAAKQTAKEVVASASCRFVALPPAASRPARSLTPGSSASSPAYYRAWLRRHGAPARATQAAIELRAKTHLIACSFSSCHG